MPDSKSSYRQIMKATSIFGGVQVFQIFISVIRSKFIAILLGPAGIGINGLLNSTTDLIAGLTNFGLGSSAVKNVASANGSGDKKRIATVVIILRRLGWFTGILGTLLTIFLSPWLSQLTFGNENYTTAFIWISITLLLNQISTGQSVVLRGMRQLKLMARSSLSGSILGLFVSVPIYYKWGIDGIVPAIIISSVISLLRTWYYSNKIILEEVKVSRYTAIQESKSMLVMGFMLSLSSLYVLAKNYGIRAFISHLGGLEQVGLFTAGLTISNSYVGMVFTAMSTDYYPRLSSVAHDNIEARNLINQQAEIAVLILAPIITFFLIFINWIIALLYSTRFLDIKEMIQWIILGLLFKSVSWSIAFIFLAKGESNFFLGNELFGGTVTFVFNILGYYFGGLTGLGISFFLGNFYYAAQVYLITKRKYEFALDINFIKLSIFQFLIILFCFFVIKFVSNPWSYFVGLPIILTSTMFSIYELDKRVGIKQIISKIKNKHTKS